MGGMDMTGFRMIPAGQGLMMPASEPWKLIEFGYVLAMWVVMMIGMMTPSAAPMILIYARVGRQAAIEGKPFAATAWFVGGYLLAWIAFSLVATSAQWMLERTMSLTPMMASANNLLGGLVLIAVLVTQEYPFDRYLIPVIPALAMFLLSRLPRDRGLLLGALAVALFYARCPVAEFSGQPRRPQIGRQLAEIHMVIA